MDRLLLSRAGRRSMVAASAAFLMGCSAAAPPPDAPRIETMATVRQIMEGITIPTSDIVWAAQNEAPSDDAGWTRIETNAMALAESGNLLRLRAMGREAWDGFATEMIAASRRAADAAAVQDLEALIAAGDQIYETCAGCHRTFMPRPR